MLGVRRIADRRRSPQDPLSLLSTPGAHRATASGLIGRTMEVILTISIPVAVCNSNGEHLSLTQHLEFSSAAEAIALLKSIDLPDSEIEPYFAAARMHLASAADSGVDTKDDALAAIDRVVEDIERTCLEASHAPLHIGPSHTDLLRAVRRCIEEMPFKAHDPKAR